MKRSEKMREIFGIVSNNINLEKARSTAKSIRQSYECVAQKDMFYIQNKNNNTENNILLLGYSGELSNAKELTKELNINANACDEEIILHLYNKYKKDCVNRLQGAFVFVVYDKVNNQIFATRDQLGIKQLYFYNRANEFVFSSNLPCVVKYTNTNIITMQGLSEVLGLGPSKTEGVPIYKNIYDIKAGHYVIIKNGHLQTKRYWHLINKEHTDNFLQTATHIREHLENSIKNASTKNDKVCSLFSGGLDSTIITMIAKKHVPNLQTFSVDYAGSGEYFTGNDFQVSSDMDYVQLVSNKYNIQNKTITLSNNALVGSIESALHAKGYPGMVDVDGSLLVFGEAIKDYGYDVVLTGEGADEIFGGYPWFYKSEYKDSFPWIRNLDYRENLLNTNYKNKLDIKNYVDYRFQETIKKAPVGAYDSDRVKEQKIMAYLNMQWFLQTLLHRTEKMTSQAGLVARLPFLNIEMVEYLYNVPWEYKFFENSEKGLLREAVKDIVPHEILYRKKSPYPKTFNPDYLQAVSALLQQVLKNPNSILHELFNKKELKKLVMKKTDLPAPWFGQLMTKPQLIAYLYQIDLWFESYNLNIE